MAPSSPALNTYQARTDLDRYGDNGLLLFALQMGLAIEDIDTVASVALTDGSDDKKCDLVYVDPANARAILAQGYFSRKPRDCAPANKASDLNTAAAWLLGAEEDQLPERLRPARNELHEALRTAQVRRLEIWYVHNLPESVNVQDELDRAGATARALLKERYPDGTLDDVVSLEVGIATLDRWYATSQVPILVTDEISVPGGPGFSEDGDAWTAYCTSVPASWLIEMFSRYGTDLFSANVRDYLGSINSDANINNNIKQTAENAPGRFFAYNNGLTILVNDLKVPGISGSPLTINGISIVNGAQTTGALANSKATSAALGEARVLTRFVKCADQRVIREIIQFNNSQNKIEAADFRSNDKIQERLRLEFQAIPDAEYRGGRRGSERDVIERRPNLIPTQTAAQAIAAFHGQPNIAYNETRRIWSSDEVYSQTFPEFITARHTLFCYSLLKAIEEAKFGLTQLPAGKRTKLQNTQVDFLRKRGSTFLTATAVASCLETILNRAIIDSWRLRFAANLSARDAVSKWQPVLLPLLSFVDQLEDALTGYLKNNEKNNSSLARFQQLVHATRDAIGAEAFSEFSSAVTDASF